MHFQARGLLWNIGFLACIFTAVIWGLTSLPLEAHPILLSLHTRASTTWSLMSSEDLTTGTANTKCSHAIKSTQTWQRQAGPTFHMVPGVLNVTPKTLCSAFLPPAARIPHGTPGHLHIWLVVAQGRLAAPPPPTPLPIRHLDPEPLMAGFCSEDSGGFP